MTPSPTGIEPEDHLPEVREPAGYSRTDDDLGADLRKRLSTATDCAAGKVVVEVRGGHVVLTGRVPSRRDRQRVEAHACAVAGVLSVHDGLACDVDAEPAGEGSGTAMAPGASARMGKPGYER